MPIQAQCITQPGKRNDILAGGECSVQRVERERDLEVWTTNWMNCIILAGTVDLPAAANAAF
jgi:hypothetical protein